jgi:hypothetical protein
MADQSSSRLDTVAIGIGLGLFGLAAGVVCGLSVADGASTSLLTTMFTFVSGAILSYSAFKVPAVIRAKAKDKDKAKGEKGEDADENTNVARVGVGVGTFSIGLLIGVLLGMWIRYDNPFHFAQHPTGKQAASGPGKVDKDQGDKSAAKGSGDDEGDGVGSREVVLHNKPIPGHVCERFKSRSTRDQNGHSWYEQQADPKAAVEAASRDIAELERYACEP